MLLYPAFSISNIKGFVAQEEQFGKDNTYSKTDKSTNYIVEPGMFAYNPARINVGSIAYQNQHEPVLVSSLYEIFKVKSEIDDSFLMNWFKTSLFNNQVKRLEEGGVRQYFFIDKMQETKIGLPSISEQKNISKILKLINKNLDLQQRKLDNLIKIRKFYLSKFFPTKRKAEPELRLKKFTNISWKNKKLGEIGKVKSGIGFPTSEQGGKVGVPFYKVSDMNNKGNEFEMVTANNYVSIDRIKANRWKVIREVPAIFFAKVGAAVLLNRKRLCRIPFLLDNNTMAYCMDQAILDPIFTKMLFETINLPSLAQLGALPSYNASDVESLFVYIPTLEEQKKLAKIFQKIDNLIVYQQKKISLLKQNKEFLLQNLFI